MTTAVVFGEIVDEDTHEVHHSYEVEPSSPGATVLSSYQLTQVHCGAPNLVEIFGPENSVICANPNHLVAAGTYNLDASTLSLSSTGQAPAAAPAPAPAPT